jgi:hypothetical protein
MGNSIQSSASVDFLSGWSGMSKSDSEMSSFLAELAGEATQRLEAKRAVQQDREEMIQSVNAALDRTFRFFHLFNKHLDALEPEIPRIYTLDGKARFSQLKWKGGLVDYRKQSLADTALLDHVLFQVKLAAPEPVALTRRWDQFNGTKSELQDLGLRPMEDLDDLWKSRPQKDTFQVNLEPEFAIRMRFQGDYDEGNVQMSCNNLECFGATTFKLQPEYVQSGLLDDIGRFLMGRTDLLPQKLLRMRILQRNI